MRRKSGLKRPGFVAGTTAGTTRKMLVAIQRRKTPRPAECLTKTVNREKDLKRRESAELLRSTPQLAEKKNTTSGRGASFAMFASRSLKNIRYLPPSQTSTNVRISTLHFQKNKAVSIHYISPNNTKNSSCNANRQEGGWRPETSEQNLSLSAESLSVSLSLRSLSRRAGGWLSSRCPRATRRAACR